MRHNILLTAIIVGVLSFSACGPVVSQTSGPQCCLRDVCFRVDVVQTLEERERGLMFRSELAADRGMLFIFPRPDVYSFWMKNMTFPIDILWLDEEKRIVYILSDVPACTADPCPVYDPPEKASYVLEISSGMAARHGFQRGDRVMFKD